MRACRLATEPNENSCHARVSSRNPPNSEILLIDASLSLRAVLSSHKTTVARATSNSSKNYDSQKDDIERFSVDCGIIAFSFDAHIFEPPTWVGGGRR